MHGTMKKRPGPLALPDLSLPSLKMTALSYSCTTFTQPQIERGRVRITRMKENTVIRLPITLFS